MSTTLFPEGLTRTAWDDLQYHCKMHDEDGGSSSPTYPDPAKGWVIRESDLITIGALTGPESHTLPGWTRRVFRYAGHVSAHGEQIIEMLAWSAMGGYQLRTNDEKPSTSAPNGYVVSEPLYFRDPDGKSAPVDATGLAGWTLYTGPVIPPKAWTEADAVKTRDDGQPVDPDFEGLTPGEVLAAVEALEAAPVEGASLVAPQPPAVKVGDRVLAHLLGAETRTAAVWYVREHTRNGALMSRYPEATEDCWCLCTPLEVLPPRADAGTALSHGEKYVSHAHVYADSISNLKWTKAKDIVDALPPRATEG